MYVGSGITGSKVVPVPSDDEYPIPDILNHYISPHDDDDPIQDFLNHYKSIIEQTETTNITPTFVKNTLNGIDNYTLDQIYNKLPELHKPKIEIIKNLINNHSPLHLFTFQTPIIYKSIFINNYL